ncbi:hypothetical protein Tco_0078442 [Tanacetum coccineum]
MRLGLRICKRLMFRIKRLFEAVWKLLVLRSNGVGKFSEQCVQASHAQPRGVGSDKKSQEKQSKVSKHDNEKTKDHSLSSQKTKALANFHLQGPFLQFPKVIYNLKDEKKDKDQKCNLPKESTVLTVKKGAGTLLLFIVSPIFTAMVPIPVTATETGPSTGLKMTVPSTAEEKICKKNDVKARTAIKARIRGNEATKKTIRRPPEATYENFNLQAQNHLILSLNRLQSLLSQIGILVWMNKPDFDTMGLNDSSKQGRKLSDAEVQEKASTETEPFIQEVTPTEVIQDQGSNEKGSAEISTAGATKGTASEVPVVSTAEENISTAGRTVTYTRRSEEKKTRQDKGKAIMTESEPKKKSRRSVTRNVNLLIHQLEEQMNEEQRAQIARDEEIARQWDEEERQRAMAEAKSTKKIDWNDPSVIRYHALKMKPKTIA